MSHAALASHTWAPGGAVPCKKKKATSSQNFELEDYQATLCPVPILRGDYLYRVYPKLDGAAPTISAPPSPSSIDFGILASFLIL